jgi:hypothetical protein
MLIYITALHLDPLIYAQFVIIDKHQAAGFDPSGCFDETCVVTAPRKKVFW